MTEHLQLPIAVGLQIAELEFGRPDFAEYHTTRRLFPKDERERRCFQYLQEQMRAAPDRAPKTRAEFEKFCRSQRGFGVTRQEFEYCWREAIKVTGACWDRPGRRRR
jgi:hypothetical protein